MTFITACYTPRDRFYPREIDCTTLDEAVRLVDGCIEDGGTGDVSVWVEPGEPVPTVHPGTLCDVHIYHEA